MVPTVSAASAYVARHVEKIDPPAAEFVLPTAPDAIAAQKALANATNTSSSSLSTFDRLLLHFCRCINTRGGTDVVLFFIGNCLRITCDSLDAFSSPDPAFWATQRFFRLLRVRFPLCSAARLSFLASLARRVVGIIKLIVPLIGNWRTMNRMLGLLGVYVDAKDVIFRIRTQLNNLNPPGRFMLGLETIQIFIAVVYHVSDAAPWLSKKKIIGLSPKACSRLDKINALCWLAEVYIDLVYLLMQRAQRQPCEDKKAQQDWEGKWKIKFLKQLSWAPVTVHGAMAQGIMPEFASLLLAAYPASASMRMLWDQTA
ncbi:unnamed protein product [Clonostachys rosea]|uniref:Pex N-terminal domain-containing protein n=1 Tax=Bionectria ochroleuca TaxID=29856 RepID=A0ABY6UUH2_BIOOC|nr:unnamed protein product [Clonostachys rosea]